MQQYLTAIRRAGFWLSMPGWLFACSSDGAGGAGSATGGAATVGAGGATSSDALGGNPGSTQATRGGTTGQSRGGTASNSTNNSGGTATSSNISRGGISGNATGGVRSTTNATGGTGTGGTGTGGTGTGGTATGGTATGGTATGGTATGGNATAGANSGTTATNTLCPGATKTISVAADGSGDYSTITAAVNAIPSNNAKPIQLNLRPGSYDEKVTINKPFVCLIGESATSTIITNTNGTNIVTGGTVIVTGNDFSAANVTFQNSAALGSAQAVALMAQGQRQQFRNCRFVSYQDTLYNNTGTQYFKDCYIQGNTDFIFGDATAVFENCTLNSVSEGTAVTAPRTPQNTTFGFVFLGGAVTANPTTATVRSNHVHLGRPWGPYAAAAFIRVDLGVHVASAGWTTMSNNDLSNTRFWEYKSTGAGANTTDPTRASRQLSDAQAANYTVKNVLSPWVPGYSQ